MYGLHVKCRPYTSSAGAAGRRRSHSPLAGLVGDLTGAVIDHFADLALREAELVTDPQFGVHFGRRGTGWLDMAVVGDTITNAG
jgi:hypothetical protein